MARTKSSKSSSSSANIGFEAKLWLAADKLRSNMDAAEYKHVVLGLIFLKYISDSFEEKHAGLTKEKGADPEDPDEYRAENIFWVPPAARWTYLQNSAKQPTISGSRELWSRYSASQTTPLGNWSQRRSRPKAKSSMSFKPRG